MAGPGTLSALRRSLGPVLLGVLLLHIIALYSLGQLLGQAQGLQRMEIPMFTRMLAQEAAPPPAAPLQPTPVGAVGWSAPSLAEATPTAALTPDEAKPPKPAKKQAGTPESEPAGAERATATAGPRGPDAPAPGASPAPALPANASAQTSAGTAVSAAPGAPASPALAAAATTANPPAATIAASSSPAAGTSTTAALRDWPTDTRLSYKLSGNYRGGIAGTARVQWLRKDSNYEARVEIEIPFLASLNLTSQGTVTPATLRPQAYEEERRSNRRTARLDDRNVILGDGRTVPRPEGVQDTASQFVELSHRFATGRDTLEVGRSVEIWLARPGGVDLWTYDIVERETLHSARLGSIEAWRLKPRPIANPRGNITAEMWFAPTLQYLPVRIRIALGDDAWVDLLVDRIEQR